VHYRAKVDLALMKQQDPKKVKAADLQLTKCLHHHHQHIIRLLAILIQIMMMTIMELEYNKCDLFSYFYFLDCD
jgi:hypothetical protein